MGNLDIYCSIIYEFYVAYINMLWFRSLNARIYFYTKKRVGIMPTLLKSAQ